jgi:tetratricopeptide (TPR) repeat protein
MKVQNAEATKVNFRESLIITDDQTWVWNFASQVLTRHGRPHVRIPSAMPIESNWRRFHKAPHILVHWESGARTGGAIIEDIRQAAPGIETLDRIIVMTVSPTHEDVVYLSELGVFRILRLRPRDKDLALAEGELERQLNDSNGRSDQEIAWRHLQDELEVLVSKPHPLRLEQAVRTFASLKPGIPTARSLDAEALLTSIAGIDEKACNLWTLALDRNPNYYLAYHHLIDHHRRNARPDKAYALLSKLQELNKANISRLVMMGEVQKDLADFSRAESHFQAALSRDPGCSRALNGLAEIRFEQGRLEESRELLSRSHLAFKAAATLNRKGIELVRARKFEDALNHYLKAQYVLPLQEKGPLLFFNIGLCYSRWGKPSMAREFLKIALIKDPSYAKAKKLIETLEKTPDQGEHSSVAS